MMKMRRLILGVAIALIAFSATTATANAVFGKFYGPSTIVTSTQTITIENSGQRAIVDNVEYTVTAADFFQTVDNENFYRLKLTSPTIMGGSLNMPPAAPAYESSYDEIQTLNVPSSAFNEAQTTGTPVTIVNTTTTERTTIDVLPVAASIGIAVGVAALAVWIGYRQAWGDATSTLLEQGLHDMTVRDVEIVGYIMQRGEFTIPELMKLTDATKITVWRTVQKLVDQGLVVQTEQTKPAANGLGGRGKPSQIYKYVGEKNKPSTSSGTSSEPKQVP
ncbi:MAG: helix-turn-helix domain-containing protein [Candidatus Hadarchaeota archaeon]